MRDGLAKEYVTEIRILLVEGTLQKYYQYVKHLDLLAFQNPVLGFRKKLEAES